MDISLNPDRLLERPRLTELQKEILKGLQEIGGEIATFYRDGILILNSDIDSKSYLLAHIAREIEGGIRDTWLAGKKSPTIRCPRCGSVIKHASHIDEICEVLAVPKNDDFAKRWHEIAGKFHKYAHRSGPWKKPREKEVIKDLWFEFENLILHRLVGSYYQLNKLLDKYLTMPEPTDESLGVLRNLLKNPARHSYFFHRLNSVGWFEPLYKNGFFNPEYATYPQPVDEQQRKFTIPHWNVLDYLEKVSKQVGIAGNERYADELLQIIKNVTEYHINNNKCLDNFRTWWYFVKILCNLPNEKITDEIVDLIPVWLDSKFYNGLPASEILLKLMPKLLASDREEDLRKVEKIVEAVTKIEWIPEYSEEQKRKIKEEYKELFNKPPEALNEDEKLQMVFFDLDKKKPVTIIEPYWIIEAFIDKQYALKIGEKCSEKIIFRLADRLRDILASDDADKKSGFSFILLPSLEDNPRPYDDGLRILTFILRDIMLGKAKTDPEALRRVITSFLGDKYPLPIFKRLALYMIACEWEDYKDIFWQMIRDNRKADLLFNDLSYDNELYEIFSNNLNKFTLEEKELAKNIIEIHAGKNSPDATAWEKQRWFSLLKDDEYFKPLYEKYKRITGRDVKYSPPVGRAEVRIGPGPAPLTKEEILKKPNSELADFLNKFKTVDFWNGPTADGLANTLQSAVAELPEKFTADLAPFLRTGYFYVYHILWGLNDALKQNKTIDWDKLLQFLQKYISQEEFWNNKFVVDDSNWNANYHWVIGMIARIIQEGCQRERPGFTENHFPIVKEILYSAIDRILSSGDYEKRTDGNFLFSTWNSTLGKLSEALLSLADKSLQVEKEKKIQPEVTWENDIRDKFSLLLDKGIPESYVWLGVYLPYLYYHWDPKWTKDRIKSITEEENWEPFMAGYLWAAQVYNDLYTVMRSHYERGIGFRFREKHFDLAERLVDHICIGYLRGIENIEDKDSLFKKLLERWQMSEIKTIIRFFWMEREYLVENIKNGTKVEPTEETVQMKEKIINFWRWVYENKYKCYQEEESGLTDDDKKILSELSLLTVYLPEINEENSKWLELSARYVENSAFFIEYLNLLKDKGNSADFIGDVYLRMLEKQTPDFRQEHIIEIVDYLYQQGKKEKADEICNTYGERGYDFLKEVWQKYN